MMIFFSKAININLQKMRMMIEVKDYHLRQSLDLLSYSAYCYNSDHLFMIDNRKLLVVNPISIN
jgi:hypothetical protein